MNKNKITIAVCGPAHSGKSVFLNQLYSILPTERRYLVRGCPDGEGMWSNGEDQHIIQLVRKKGKFTPEFVKNVTDIIDTVENDIVLVDVGGIPSKENVKIMSHCDYYVIVSRDKAKTFEWERFLDSFRIGAKVPVQEFVKKDDETILIEKDMWFDDIIKNEIYPDGKPKSPKLLAVLESVLDKGLEDTIYEEDGILRGKVTNLSRDKKGANLSVVALAKKLIKEVKLDRLDSSKQSNVELEDDEEYLNEVARKNRIDMAILKQYISTYMRMFVTGHPKFIYRLPIGEQKQRIDLRELKRKKHVERIEYRVSLIRQKFLLEALEKYVVKKDIIDMNKIAEFFGMRDENGVINWREDRLAEVDFLVATIMKDMDKVKIYGARPNWLACSIEEIAKENGIKDISFYDLRKDGVPLARTDKYQRESSIYNKTTESYIASREMKKLDSTAGVLDYDILESDESVVLYVNSKKAVLEESDLKDIVLPKISENKRLYISGRLPLWVTTSIVKSYDNTEKSVHQPNKGFIKFASKDFRTLGTIERNPIGIDFRKYLEEKEAGR